MAAVIPELAGCRQGTIGDPECVHRHRLLLPYPGVDRIELAKPWVLGVAVETLMPASLLDSPHYRIAIPISAASARSPTQTRASWFLPSNSRRSNSCRNRST